MGAGLGTIYASVFPSQVTKHRLRIKSKSLSDQADESFSSSYINTAGLEFGSEVSNQNYPIVSQVERLILLDLLKPITGDGGKGYAEQVATGIEKFLAMEEKIQPIPPSYTFADATDRLIKATYNSLSEEAAKTLMVGKIKIIIYDKIHVLYTNFLIQIRGAKPLEEGKWAFTRDIRLRNPSITRFSHEQCFAILEKIRCEILLIKAKNAPWFEPEDLCRQAMDVYQRNCASYEFVEIDGNHFVHLNEPEKIADKINQFLTKPSIEKAGL